MYFTTSCQRHAINRKKTFHNRDSIRKAREAFSIQEGRTIDPHGLNIREETLCFLLLCNLLFYFTIYVYL